MLGKDGILMSSQTINGEDKQETIKIGDKDIPVINAKSQTIITNRTTGVIYKKETSK
jgi:hypothetical protein